MTRRVIGVLLAIVLAVVGTVAVFFYVATTEKRVTADLQPVRVLVAKERIPAGTSGARIRDKELFEEVVMPKSSVPDDVLQAIPVEFDKLVITSDVQPRQLILRGLFGQATKLSGGISVTEKLLAVSAKFKAEEEVGGFVRPGSTVAVFATCEIFDADYKKKYGENNWNTRLLLPRVEVLAVGAYGNGGQTSAQSADERAKAEDSGKVTLLVTVAVSQADAERLVHTIRVCDGEETFGRGGLYLPLLTDSSEIKPGPGVDNISALR
jgi:pilus assembly protein CpaB